MFFLKKDKSVKIDHLFLLLKMQSHGKSLVKIYEELGMEVFPTEYLPDDYEGPSAGTVKEIIGKMFLKISILTCKIVNTIRSLHGRGYRPEYLARGYLFTVETRLCREKFF
jgi:hypothetical protein